MDQGYSQGNARAISELDAAAYIGMSRSFLAQSRMDGNRHNRTPPTVY